MHRLKDAAANVRERDRALKWIRWLPRGHLHASYRGGQKGARKYRDLARRFVTWRKKDMQGFLKTWRMMVVKAEKNDEGEGEEGEGR